MIPVHELLNRILWDREFGRGFFEIGYYDRVDEEIIRVPLSEIIFNQGKHGPLQIMNRNGVIISVPLHRVKEVYKDNELIWSREH